MKPITWERNPDRFANGSICKVGDIKVAYTVRSIGNKSTPDAPLWRADILLPMLRLIEKGTKEEAKFYTEEGAKAAIEKAVATWFKWTTEPTVTMTMTQEEAATLL